MKKIILAIFLLVGASAALAQVPLPLPAGPPLAIPIVIDPGHGGEDQGIIFADSLKEKELTLRLAQSLKLLIETSLKAPSTLTREADFNPSLFERAALANSTQANLFVSLHFAEPRTADGSEILIYYHAPVEATSKDEKKTTTDYKQLTLWKEAQLSHLKKSQFLAGQVHAAFYPSWQRDAPPVMGLPLALLAGVNMPAILIEMTGLGTGKTTLSMAETWLNQIAETILKGIESYREKSPIGN